MNMIIYNINKDGFKLIFCILEYLHQKAKKLKPN